VALRQQSARQNGPPPCIPLESTSVRHAYPLMLDLTDRLIVIVGGGAVALRKANGLLAAGAQRIHCVAPAFTPDLPPQVQRIQAEFQPAHLDGASLVFAATDSPQVNETVVREAHRRGLLVNRADSDDDHPGDFTTPAVWRSDAVTLAVSAAGSPALAAAIRDDIATRLDPLQLRMAQAMQTLRPLIVASPLLPQLRRQVFLDLVRPEAMHALAQTGVQGLLAWLAQRHPNLKDIQCAMRNDV